MQSLKKKETIVSFLFFGLQVIGSQWPRPAGSSRDHVLGRPCTPIHCLCDAYLGYTNSCYKVALPSVIIANTLDWMICPPSSRDKQRPDKHHRFSAECNISIIHSLWFQSPTHPPPPTTSHSPILWIEKFAPNFIGWCNHPHSLQHWLLLYPNSNRV